MSINIKVVLELPSPSKEAIYQSNLRITNLAYCFQHSFQNISKKHHKNCQRVKWTIDSEYI